MARRSGCRLLALAVLGIFLPQVCFNVPRLPRRELVLSLSGAALLPTEAAYAAGFSPSDLGSAEGLGTEPAQVQRVEDVNELEQAVYLISRVQEATVQQERLVATGKFKDVQRNSITTALNMMLDNYKLADQVVAASGYVEPKASIMQASQVGNEAVDALETAKEYFGTPLKVSGLSEEQRKFLKQAMQACRDKLDRFLAYIPEDVVNKARKRVEDENALNLAEYVGEEGGILNPVVLPWKEAKKKVPR